MTEATFFRVANEFHPYYMVTLAPAIAALVGIGPVALWDEYRERRAHWWLLPAALAVTAVVQWRILAGYPIWSARLTPIVLGAGILAPAVLVAPRLRSRIPRFPIARSGSGVRKRCSSSALRSGDGSDSVV